MKYPRNIRKYLDLPAVYAGVLILIISYVTGWSNHNWILLLGLICIIVGICFYIYNSKKQSKY